MSVQANTNELTAENCAVILIDHQPMVALGVQSIELGLLLNNVAGLAQTAKLLGVPTILTTVGAKGSVLADPIFKVISDAFPDIKPIDRTSTNSWPDIRSAVRATGRKKLVMAGLLTEVCLAQAVLPALKDGYEVFIVSDCSGGCTREAHEDAKTRLTMAGARPINWLALTGELAPDYTSAERASLTPLTLQRGSNYAVVTEYVLAQVTEGVVPPPDFLPSKGKK
jgi:nicotinamidase-related amidase